MGYKDELTGEGLEVSSIYMLIYIKPMTKANRENMLFALKKIKEVDEKLVVYTNENDREIIVAGMGKKHLENIVHELMNEYGIELTIEKKQAFYKETIINIVRSEGKFIRQSSSRDSYGHCWIEIAPNERDTGSKFINNIQDDEVIPKEFIPYIESGIKLGMTNGVMTGFQVSDIQITLYDGSYNYIDSSNMSFKIAALKALKEGLKKNE